MLYRKIEHEIEAFLKSDSNKILLVDGARQVGKSFIIRHVGQRLFENYVEINLQTDAIGERLFADVHTLADFYLQLGAIGGMKLQQKHNTLVFLDEIQAYPHLLTLLKFLKADDRYTYIASGSLLGVTLMQTPSIPIGSINVKQMFPLDFEEFLIANGFSNDTISALRDKFEAREALNESLHNRVMSLFRRYLLTGGLPDAVNMFLEEFNIPKIREIQKEIRTYYAMDASRYDLERKLKIRRVYEMIPSNLENKKKRIIVKNIEGKEGKQFSDYQDEFDYLISSGIALDVTAISNPKFPLIESARKNLLKLYLNDVGLLTGLLYGDNLKPVLDDVRSINLGTVYESVVAQELKAHGHTLYYYDNKQNGEVDFMIDDFQSLSVLPIEVKSGKDYSVHSALSHFVSNEEFAVNQGLVLYQEREFKTKGRVLYVPVYFSMFL